MICVVFFSECKNPDLNKNAEKLITEHFRLLNAHNLKDLAKQYSAKAWIESPGMDNLPLGGFHPSMREYELYFMYCDSTKFRVEQTLYNDSLVAVQYEITGRPKKLSPPLLTNFYPNGLDLENCSIFKIKGGKIVSESIYINHIVHD